jgi:hypothetical protein
MVCPQVTCSRFFMPDWRPIDQDGITGWETAVL